MVFEFVIKEKIDIKSFLLKNNFSKRIVNKLLNEKKNIFINNKAYCQNYFLNINDKLKIVLEENSQSPLCNKPISIVFEDEFFLVVNKPKDLAVIPSFYHYEDNLSSRVLNYYQQTNQNVGIHVVNRLDLPTSGLVIFAKSQYIHSIISKIKITKKYRCSVNGILENKSGIINQKLSKSPNSLKRVIDENGKQAITKYSVIEEKNNITKLDIELLTGRTHQIRVCFSSLGHSLVGDKLYGDGIGDFDLCSYYLSFVFPLTNKKYEITI